MRWIELDRGPVPIEFSRLVEATVQSPEVLDAIDDLLREKRSGAELDRGPHSPAISGFIEKELARLEEEGDSQPVVQTSSERLDECFREILMKTWDGPWSDHLR